MTKLRADPSREDDRDAGCDVDRTQRDLDGEAREVVVERIDHARRSR